MRISLGYRGYSPTARALGSSAELPLVSLVISPLGLASFVFRVLDGNTSKGKKEEAIGRTRTLNPKSKTLKP